jgi:hypothetical protein
MLRSSLEGQIIVNPDFFFCQLAFIPCGLCWERALRYHIREVRHQLLPWHLQGLWLREGLGLCLFRWGVCGHNLLCRRSGGSAPWDLSTGILGTIGINWTGCLRQMPMQHCTYLEWVKSPWASLGMPLFRTQSSEISYMKELLWAGYRGFIQQKAVFIQLVMGW